jgi:hypothetical protein
MFGKILKALGYVKASEIPTSNPAASAEEKKPTPPPFTKVEKTGSFAGAEELRRLRTEHLNQLEAALEKVPGNANFGGTAFVLDGDKVETISLTSKNDAIALIHRARKGEVSLVF